MLAPDPHNGFSNISSQGERWVTVTPSDTAHLAEVPKALWVNVAGDLTVVGEDGVAATFAVLAGLPILLRPRQVMATGTTATGIIAIY